MLEAIPWSSSEASNETADDGGAAVFPAPMSGGFQWGGQHLAWPSIMRNCLVFLTNTTVSYIRLPIQDSSRCRIALFFFDYWLVIWKSYARNTHFTITKLFSELSLNFRGLWRGSTRAWLQKPSNCFILYLLLSALQLICDNGHPPSDLLRLYRRFRSVYVGKSLITNSVSMMSVSNGKLAIVRLGIF